MSTKETHHNALKEGSILNGQYKIISILGSGGFGITYLAEFIKLESKVVIKEYFPNDLANRDEKSTIIPLNTEYNEFYQKGKDRFLFEAKTIAKFKHPYIVKIINYFEANNTAYFVMDYEEGEDLSQYLKRHQFTSEEEILLIIVPILDALSEIHKEHIYHRDIKPDNIYLRKSGGPMLIDFGAAKESFQEGSKNSSFNPQTAGYAAPEQKSSITKYIGAHTDIYAVGAVLHKIVTGETPPQAGDRSIAKDNEGVDSYKPLAEQNIKGFSKEFLKNIDWALEYYSKQRPQSTEEFKKALMSKPTPVTEEREQEPPKEKPEQTDIQAKPKKKNPLLFIMIAVVIFISGIVVYQVKEDNTQKARLALAKKYGHSSYPEETFYDADTKLMWQDNNDAKNVQKDWSSAKAYCENLTIGNYRNWRLPEYNELLSIVDYNRYAPAIKKGFKNVASGYYWSSSEYVYDSSNAWYVYFYSGNTYYGNKTHKYYVRCVRGRQ